MAASAFSSRTYYTHYLIRTPKCSGPARKGLWRKRISRRSSHPQPLALQPLVDVGDAVAVAVEDQRRPVLAGADHFLARLAPARMRHCRIDVGPEAVFRRLQRLPITLRPLLGEAEAHDRLDRLEAVFPRHRQPQRRAVLLEHRVAVGASGEEGEFVARFRHGEAFDIRPGKQGLPLPGRLLRIR